jgi:hypothetical protein
VIDGPFAVINADDYYGQEAFSKIYDFLMEQEDGEKYQYAMVGYLLENTLTEHGHVARGVCEIDGAGKLSAITERTRIERRTNGPAFTEDEGVTWQPVSGEAVVSMNMWGFTASMLRELRERFATFLQENLPENPQKCEYFLPFVVDELIREEKAEVTVLKSQDRWYGVTYKEDKPVVVKAIQDMKEKGLYPQWLWKQGPEELLRIAECFCLSGEVDTIEPYGSGHINDTFLVTCRPEKEKRVQRYILQRMNHQVFRNPEELMENVVHVTEFLQSKLRESGGDTDREAMRLIPTRDKGFWVKTLRGDYWRVYVFVEGASSYDTVVKPEDFYESAVAFGHFQKLLWDFPAASLHETIPNFHNTVARLKQFQAACAQDVCGRVKEVEEEIRFVLDRQEECHILCDMLAEGKLPLRVTHNDTKLNNVLIDNVTGKGICVIDLDTVMPGSALYDFGDSIRFGANTGAEDEKDLSKISCDMELFALYVKGFIHGCEGTLTSEEIRMMPMGAKLMTLECGMRFLADYLEGDVYFKIHRPEQNLDRCRTQFRMVADMEEKWETMERIVGAYLPK